MAKRRKRIVLPPPTLIEVDELSSLDALPETINYDVVEEWEPEPPVERWSDWQLVSVVKDEDPTYYPEYDLKRRSLFHVPLKELHPVKKRTTTWERHLLRRWVDQEKGPMAQKVRTETRVDRW